MAEIVKNVYKIIILGDPRVGKTSLRLRYLGKGFQKEYISTIGADFAVANYKDSFVQIWDLAGEYHFSKFVRPMFLGAQGVMIAFDLTNEQSMQNIPKWIENFHQIEPQDIPIVIIGNKVDLRDNTPFTIRTSKAEEFVKDLSIQSSDEIEYVETSALTGANIQNAFNTLVDRIISKKTEPVT